MCDSDTYQAILDEDRSEGRVDELHRTLIRLGRKRFGEPDAETRQMLNALHDPERLETLIDRLLDVSTWDELLA